MTRYATVETLNPRAVIKSVTKKLPSGDILQEARKTSRRTLVGMQKFGKQSNKAVQQWWKKLPNDGVRASLPIAAALTIAGIAASVIFIRRRG